MSSTDRLGMDALRRPRADDGLADLLTTVTPAPVGEGSTPEPPAAAEESPVGESSSEVPTPPVPAVPKTTAKTKASKASVGPVPVRPDRQLVPKSGLHVQIDAELHDWFKRYSVNLGVTMAEMIEGYVRWLRDQAAEALT